MAGTTAIWDAMPLLVGGFNSGDDGMDGKLDPGEDSLYTHTKTVTTV